MRVDLFDFDLPTDRIALRPARPRDAARLLHVGATGAFADLGVTELPNLLRAGDVLVVWRLDRLGRNLPDLVRIVGELESGKAGLESITENIETVSSTGRLVFHVFAALAEFERNVISERTLAGLKAARARGRLGGRPEKLSAKDKQQIGVLLKDPAVRVKDVAKRFGVSVATLYKHIGVVTPEK